MSLSKKKMEMLKKMPMIKNEIRKSKDGRFIIHRVIITDVKPWTYYEAVINNKEEISVLEEDTDLTSFMK